jgi:molybdenum cofactor cytidylyltransferase
VSRGRWGIPRRCSSTRAARASCSRSHPRSAAQGLLASVKAGIKAALEEDPELVLLHPVDMPALRVTTLKSLLKGAGEGNGLRPDFEGAPGWPLVLSRQGAEALLNGGAKDLDAALKGLGLSKASVKDPGVVVNINNPEIYERLFGSAPKLAPAPKKRGKKAQAAE